MRIAIVKLSALGDIVHAMIVIQFIKKFDKDILIDWVVDRSYEELLEFHPDINKIHSLDIQRAKKNKSILSFIRELNKVRKLDSYDLVIDLQGLVKSAVIAKFITSSLTVGFDKFSARESFASMFYDRAFNCAYDQNIIERNIKLIEFAFGMRISQKQIQNKNSFLFSSNSNLNTDLSIKNKNIILIPGASHRSKRYPAYSFAKLVNLIDANFIVIWGNPHEYHLAEKIKQLAPKVIICEKLSIDALKFLISKSDLVIGPDSGPTHMAWALNVASITLFGSTPGYRNTYETDINKIIESSSVVNSLKIDKNDYSIKEIKVGDIVKIMKTLFKAIQ